MSEPMRAVCMGAHVLDVLVRPVETIPEGQGGQLVEQIKMTARTQTVTPTDVTVPA